MTTMLKEGQHLRPLPLGLPRRPRAAAYGLGPSVFTIRATKTGTDHASVSQAVACRGAPPLPASSLGPCRCCRGKQAGFLWEGEGSWAWTRRNLVCGSESIRRVQRRWGEYRVDCGSITDDRKNLLVVTVVGHLSSVSSQERGAEGAVATESVGGQ